VKSLNKIMNKISNNLIKNPLFKIIGIILIIYFALFDNKENPQSLANRLSVKQLQQNASEVKEKTHFILYNLQNAKEAQKIIVEDKEVGIGESLRCLDEADLSYKIFVKNISKEIEEIHEKKILIGGRKNLIIERNVVGMKAGGVRIINVPSAFQTTDEKLSQLFKTYSSDVKYEVSLLKFTKLKPVANIDLSSVDEDTRNKNCFN
jgi:hypothetical protein